MRARSPGAPPLLVYVLSGGGVKGFCHLGMLEVLEGRGLRPDLVVGTSAGALAGALYSHFGSVAGVRRRVEEVLSSEEFAAFDSKYLRGRNAPEEAGQGRFRHYLSGLSDSVRSTARFTARIGRTLLTSAMVTEEDRTGLFRRIFAGMEFGTLAIPFAAVAVDLLSGLPVIHDSRRPLPGPEGLLQAVMASCAIPLVFPAVHVGGQILVDGGIMSNLPARQALSLLAGREAVILGLDVSTPYAEPEGELSSLDLSLRLLDLAMRSRQAVDREVVDILFRPLLEPRTWSSIEEREELVALGRACVTEEGLDAIEELCRDRWLANLGKAGSWALRLLARLGFSRRDGSTRRRP